ncbi:hypothetical protein [Cutibacterium sp. V947]|uniref:hypothetical protein n=1 Tax=unclassified Cutibacterium TaxID=2649671 RepID=UPI003EE29C14
MNDLVLATTVRTQLAMKSIADKLRQERGASALEYVGMLLIGAVIVGAVHAAINPGTVGKWVKTATDVIGNIHP